MESTLVGRVAEVVALDRMRATAATGSGAATLLVGEAGIGKTAVVLTDATPTVDGCRFTAITTVDRVAAGVRTGRLIVGRYLDITISLCVTAD